jgi:type IV secretory pathway VirB4 component
MDEAWRFIQHPTLRAYVEEALKTWRKRNGAMWLATQSVEDFASADLLRTVVEACPTKLLLANPALDRARYAEPFGTSNRWSAVYGSCFAFRASSRALEEKGSGT